MLNIQIFCLGECINAWLRPILKSLNGLSRVATHGVAS